MHRFICFVTAAIALSAAAGCGAHATSAPPATSAAATTSATDPSWCPPEETEIAYGDDARDTQLRRPEATTIKPNASERPNLGAVHAAVY